MAQMDTRTQSRTKVPVAGTITLDASFKILSWSRAVTRMLGFSREEAVDRSALKLLFPADRQQRVRTLIRQVIQADEADCKSWLYCKNRPMIFTSVRFRAARGKDGQLKHVSVHISDETRQASLLDARSLKKHYGSLLNSMPDHIIVINPGERIVLVNSLAKRLFAYNNEELVGEPVERVLPGLKKISHLMHSSENGLSCGSSSTDVEDGLRCVDRNGSDFPVEVRQSPMQTESGLMTIIYIMQASQSIKTEEELALAQLYLHTQYAISKILSSMNSFEAIIPDLLSTICINLKFSAGRIWEIDRQTGRFQCLAGWIDQPRTLAKFQSDSVRLSIATNSGIPGRVSQSREAAWIERLSADPGYKNFSEEFRSLIRYYMLEGMVSFPILLNDNVTGVITLFKREPLAFDRQLHGQLASITTQIGQFLERRAQQYSITKLNRIYTVRSGINNTIVHIHDRNRLLNIACDIIITSGKFSMVWIGLLDEMRTRVSEIYSGSRSADCLYLNKLDRYLRRKPHNEHVINAINNRNPLLSNNLHKNDPVPLANYALAMGCRSALAIPFNKNSVPDGIIVIYADEKDYFDDDEILLLKELSNDIAFAMQYIHNEEKLKFLAYCDPITGLNNRTSLYSLLDETVAFNQEGEKSFALLLANINNFRDINDTLGHQTGDDLIRQVSKRLVNAVWESDYVASLGGDNFAILLHRLSDKQDISIVVKKITESFKESFLVSDIPINVEVTIGIALFPDHGETADLLWQHADVALRKARQLDQTHLFYSKEIDHFDPLKLTLLGELRKAIDNNELVLYYQPKIDLLKRQTVGVEALIRWQHPERGMIYPDSFIPLAEQTELINPLSLWVIENAMIQVLRWHDLGYFLDLAINLSARNLQYPELVDRILHIVGLLEFPLDKLLLEITETAIMSDPVNAGQQLAKLHDVGIQLSLDDFGIGQSSLTYLKDLPLKNMKIDKSFVMNINLPSNFAIVRSAVELGHNMEFDVTAEGIEDGDSFSKLQEFNCNYGQGYFFSKPLPADELTEWLEHTEWIYRKDN